MRCTTDDGVDIEYDRTGAGPPILLVHGLTDSRSDWRPVIERLAPDFTCVALDLRGHGASGDAADYSALAMTADLAAVVRAEDLHDPAVIGHSLGGAVVTAYAAEAPVAAVVNVDQLMKFSDFAAAVRPLEPALRSDAFSETIAMVLESMIGPMADADLRAELATHRARARQDVVLGVWDLIFSAPDEALDGIADTLAATISRVTWARSRRALRRVATSAHPAGGRRGLARPRSLGAPRRAGSVLYAGARPARLAGHLARTRPQA